MNKKHKSIECPICKCKVLLYNVKLGKFVCYRCGNIVE